MVQLLPVNSLRLMLALLLIIFLVGMCTFSNNLVDDIQRESVGSYKGGDVCSFTSLPCNVLVTALVIAYLIR